MSTNSKAPATKTATESRGIEQLTDVLELFQHVEDSLERYLKSSEAPSSKQIMSLVMTEVMLAAPKIRDAIQGADLIRAEVLDLSFQEFQTLNRTYAEPILFAILQGATKKLLA